MGCNIYFERNRGVIIIKRKTKILTVFAVILFLLIIFAVWQKDNIEAFIMGLTTTEEKLLEKREENDKIITDTLEKYPELTIRDLTPEEKMALGEGKITESEALLIMQGKITLEELLNKEPPVVEEPTEEPEPSKPDVPIVEEPDPVPPERTEPEPTPPAATEPDEAEPMENYDEQISALVGRMYVLKAEFTSKLKTLEDTTLKSYAALPAEEKTAEVKADMMKKVLDTVSAMEKECDTAVEAVLTELREVLVKSGKDTVLVNSIEEAYKNEKTITKAEYINTYFK